MAYENLAEAHRPPEGVKSVCHGARATVGTLRHAAGTNAARDGEGKPGDADQRNAEKKAAALPPKLTVPMIVFFLPVLFVVILGPALHQDRLHGPRQTVGRGRDGKAEEVSGTPQSR
jgi:tight adherence protein C